MEKEFELFKQFLRERNTLVLLHIPHASIDFPNHFFKGVLLDAEYLYKYAVEMGDIFVDEIFKDFKAKKLLAKYSRLYCDLERYRDDKKEIMSKYGQGVVYTHTYNNILFHIHDDLYKEKVLRYYDKFHKKFDKAALRIVKKGYNLLILDCHSFSEKMASQLHVGPFPDICIGTEEEFYNLDILNYIKKKILEKGLTYKENFPYSGSIIPNAIYNKKEKYKGRVISIMIEINKKLYLKW